jgi:hypothetical protein
MCQIEASPKAWSLLGEIESCPETEQKGQVANVKAFGEVVVPNRVDNSTKE